MGKGSGGGWGSGQYKGKFERVIFPAMPIPIAIICCVLNFIIPGLGTAIAGLAVFCCSRNEDLDNAPRVLSCFTSCGIGVLQLLTTLVLFLGWFWSCFWGVTYIVSSLEYYHNNKVDDHDAGTATVHNVPTTHTVYEAGSSTATAIIVQPTHLPYRVVQPTSKAGQKHVTTQPLSAVALNSQQTNVQPGHKAGQGNITTQPLSAGALSSPSTHVPFRIVEPGHTSGTEQGNVTGNAVAQPPSAPLSFDTQQPPPYPGNHGDVIPGPLPTEPPPAYSEMEKLPPPPASY